ncbi:MAG: prepilin-type N-terminal cleavage/methylation domain-containing protein [Candidatus Eisenbacteria bacterium]|nr:prepilin-type N-terminal cleavage/methylation domain-containing protein [Candidatus Eisenbacteria bacterium]
MDARQNKEKGFSLVELVFAVGILALAFLAMGRLFVTSIEHSRQGRHDMIALNSANEILERMRSIDFDDVPDKFDGLDTADSASVPNEVRVWFRHMRENLGPTARCEINVFDENEKAQLTNGLIEVEILTSWTERGRERTMRTGTYLVRMGS